MNFNVRLDELTDMDILQMQFECMNNMYTILNEVKNIHNVQNMEKIKLDKKDEKIKNSKIEVKKTKTRKKRKKIGKNAHISEHKGYEQYKRPRVYDNKSKTWSLKNKSKYNRSYFYLPFTDVVIIATNFKSGVGVMDIINLVQSHTKSLSSQCIRIYIKYWRAGSFNDAIYENARKFGYDPQELISTECH